MRIAVLIVNYNAGAHLARALAAVAAQRRPADRVIVVDNASTDGSQAACAAHPSVTLVQSTANDGFARANNRGVREADGCDWIALLNPDAFPEPGWLEALEAAARAHADVAMFASQQRMAADPSRLDGAGDVYHVSGLAWRAGYGESVEAEQRDEHEVFSPCGAAAFIRRDVFVAAGGFDERYFAYMEDVDLGFRLRLAGHRCLYVPAARVLHVGSGSSAVHSPFAVYHGHRNLVWTFVKNMPAGWLALYLPQHLLLTVATVVRFALRGQAGTVLRAKWDALAGLAPVLAERRRLQAGRRVPASALRRVMAHGWATPYRVHLRRPGAGASGVP
jgi:GT2 family glycosyltransferase